MVGETSTPILTSIWGIEKAQKVVSTHPKSIAINRMAVKAEQTHTSENTNSTFATKD